VSGIGACIYIYSEKERKRESRMANSNSSGPDPDRIQEGDTVVFDVNNKLKVHFIHVKEGRWVF
jgi:hypothetical protein